MPAHVVAEKNTNNVMVEAENSKICPILKNPDFLSKNPGFLFLHY